jgi:hypothetical protein
MTLGKMRYFIAGLMVLTLLWLSWGLTTAHSAQPQSPIGTAFTYQGYLTTSDHPVEDSCDMQFSLWTEAAAGTQAGSTLDRFAVPLSKGRFTVQLDFGSVFDGTAYWLKIAVRCPAGTGNYTDLTPRQALTAAPYAQSAPWSGLSNIPAGFADNVDNDTVYAAGPGLLLSSGLTLTVNFTGTGTADTVARSDHDHWGANWTGSGTGLRLSGTTALSGTGSLYGLFGESTGYNGQGVSGIVDSSAGFGVFGQADNASCDPGMPGDICAGVEGKSNEAFGVRGETANGVALGGYMTGSGTGLSLLSAGSGYFISAGNYFPANTKFSVDATGNVKADGSFTSPAADMAEMLPATDGLEPGDVLVIGLDGKLARSSQAYQTAVVGVYSTQPAFVGGGADEGQNTAGQVPLAVIGIVPVKVSAENGSIRPGDLLVASTTPGHAMRAGAHPLIGSVIGKALAGWDKGTGTIRMLVVLQ